MAGKRLLDAAKLFSAGGSVAKHHFNIRRDQWQLFTRTSGLAKAVKGQTDRVTVTAGAAIELAKRFNEKEQIRRDSPQPQDYGGREPSGNDWVKERVDEAASNAQAAARELGLDTVASGINQARAQASDDGSLASLRREREIQQAKSEVVRPPAESVQTESAGQDTFNERPNTRAPDLEEHSSKLSSSRLPEHAERYPEGEKLPEKELNQDVFPSPSESADTPPEGVVTDIFHSRKVARVLGESAPDLKNPYGKRQKMAPKPHPDMVQWSKMETETPKATQKPADIAETAAIPTKDQSKEQSKDDDLHDLAASLASDAETADEASSVSVEEPASKPYEMHESRVPSSRFGRLWQYGGLATSMAFGAVGESFRRVTGGTGTGSLMLSEGNMNRLVAKLSRMRGAALKMGQMVSFQDSKVLPQTINTILQRVQDSADYMPAWQRDKVLTSNLGSEWRELFSNFEEKPFAAASIGQVHKATLNSNGKDVAVKIQYPGVRNSIDSDLNNLSLLLTASNLLPKGLFLDKTIANARTELGWECDYEREAKACIRFRDELLGDEKDTFLVPKVYTEASGMDVLTAEFMHGKGVTKIPDLKQHERDWIGTQILRLCLRELMEWRFMQTDPNWTNFLYNRSTKKIELLDFGASRDFPDKFVEPYVALLIAASKGDRETCKNKSVELGYLTGREGPEMLKAHVDSILTLAEPFLESAPEVYDFEDQTITDRVRSNIGLMLRERQAPPPEETYSLHRKLSGFFVKFYQDGTGELCAFGELGTGLMIAMTMQWKFISTFTTDFIDDERFRHIKHTNMLSKRPKLLGSFRLEMQLNSRAPKDMYLSGRAEGLERNTKLFLSDAAFLSRQFTVIIEKGNFAAVTDYNTGGRRELRMTFDASPYPAREAYRVDRTSGPGLEDFYDWLSVRSFYHGEISGELKKARATEDDTILGFHTSNCVVS
ncbi:unnamed protein product [Zymoseptoria tritici ST99CH_1A5]|uniref:ABC1 atypical kinase-like domain-containing protein n=1 Tax=Zymoseptoria tritici ST99CH_1A5 TaxID=1276529 RepID=A0A1Y6LT94_ZYMTR|nr:unnamed protein product [Zymoseptoria tritici ST99CH_3D1]SMY26839.1 unnamed protein product [Zymoseptoria tritici ST99CH_1A5]